jgi:glycosyltransferase involved in cell wall biosynthesis
VKILVVATHPIQYQAPWFRALAARSDMDLCVAYGLLPSPAQQSVGFGVPFSWDLPLLEGYRSIVVRLANQEPSLGRFFGLRAAALGAVLDRESPDALIVPGWNSWLLGQALVHARRRGLPVVLRSEANDFRPRRAWVRALQRRIVAAASAHLAIGSANRRFLLARGVDESRIFDAPYFVDNRRFAAESERLRPQREALRASWGVAPQSTCVLFAGKLTGKKRPGDLVAAVARAKGAGLHLLFAGDGGLRDELERGAAESGISATFAGFLNQSEMPRAYAAADLLALPSDAGETWGLVVNEAMASGRPAVVSDQVGCGEDLVEEGRTGWRYRCGDLAALAHLLSLAGAAGAALQDMGREASKRVAEAHSIERTVDATVRACEFATRAARG